MSSNSEPQTPLGLEPVVATTRFARIGWVTETGSTNDDLAAVASAGGAEQVLVADLQTAGRGRRDRVWTAPRDSSILMSLLIRDRRDIAPFWTIGCVGVAAADAISAHTSVPCRLKWPNDLLLDGGKVAGILAKLHDDALIVGIGINVAWDDGRPDGVPDTATAVGQHLVSGDSASAALDRESLVGDIVRRLDALLSADHDEVHRRWSDACATIGAEVRVEMDDGSTVTGRCTAVERGGGLVIATGHGSQTVHVGDVVHLRPV